MPNHLYRFRSIDALLGPRQELEKQEIYFAPPEQLNDPVEGFKDIFWTGDEIVWRNLLKHYLLCLEQYCVLLIVGGEIHKIETPIPVFLTDRKLPTDSYRDLYKTVCREFFSLESLAKLPKFLADRGGPIRREELSFYLQSLHFYALDVIFRVYESRNLMSKRPDNDALKNAAQKTTDTFEKLFTSRDIPEQPHSDVMDQLFSAMGNANLQIQLMGKYNNPDPGNSHNRVLTFVEFPGKYVAALENLVHPKWYTACFLGNHSNPAMWGHYADSHRGCCLKFKARVTGTHSSITLRGVSGWRSDKSGTSPTYGPINHELHPMKYLRKFPEVDFFKSLGNLPRGEWENHWYTDESGNVSITAGDIFKSEDLWREGYWKVFFTGITTKLPEWSYEEEHRLILTSMLHDFEDPSLRKLKFEFGDLEGIIFGIKTTDEHKLAIIKAIEAKCKKDGRKDFKFYQASYSRSSGSIHIAELTLLRFEF